MKESTRGENSENSEDGPHGDSIWCNIDSFLTKNEMLIYDFANRILKRQSYDKEDIRMEAAVAYYETLNYINSFKKTKYSTVFVWFYKKRLYKKSKLDATGTLSRNCRFSPDGDIPNESFTKRRPDLYERGSIASSSLFFDKGLPQNYPDSTCSTISGNYRFTVCVESFIGKVSIKTYRALIILLGPSHVKLKKKALRKLFKCQSSVNIENIIKSQIMHEIKDAGVNLYIADCLSGIISRIVVCARSEQEAGDYLERYGEPIEMRLLW
ncbi:MAG: hypothetical protein M1510_09605 [Nitrospirae bacterium]|nr:hypothetical protein [Nitrospirota bacterium]MCL5238375.1 hypothetical protein [Nitrospirota bacterium]